MRNDGAGHFWTLKWDNGKIKWVFPNQTTWAHEILVFILVLSSDNEPQRVNSCLLVLLLSFRRFIARRGKGVCKYLRPLDHVSLANVSLNYLTLLSDIRPVRKKLARAQSNTCARALAQKPPTAITKDNALSTRRELVGERFNLLLFWFDIRTTLFIPFFFSRQTTPAKESRQEREKKTVFKVMARQFRLPGQERIQPPLSLCSSITLYGRQRQEDAIMGLSQPRVAHKLLLGYFGSLLVIVYS